MRLKIANSVEPFWWAAIGAVSEVPGTIINACCLCSSSALTFWRYAAGAYWELLVEDCPPEWSGAVHLFCQVDRKRLSYSPQTLLPKFLLWALSLLAGAGQVCLLRSDKQKTATAIVCFLSVCRIPAGHPFGCKNHTTPSVEWPAFWIQSLQGLCSHPFISDVLEEELLKMGRAHCNFEGRALWNRNLILQLLLYIDVAEGIVGGNVHHYSQSNLSLLPCWLCSSQLRHAHHFVPALWSLFDHSVSLGSQLLVIHVHSS